MQACTGEAPPQSIHDDEYLVDQIRITAKIDCLLAPTSDSGEPWVVPSTYKALVDKPVQLTLREQGVDEVKTTIDIGQNV